MLFGEHIILNVSSLFNFISYCSKSCLTVRKKQPEKPKKPFCYFAVPDDDTTHQKIEGSIVEGMYWKRKMEGVCAQYKRWRIRSKHNLVTDKGGMVATCSSTSVSSMTGELKRKRVWFFSKLFYTPNESGRLPRRETFRVLRQNYGTWSRHDKFLFNTLRCVPSKSTVISNSCCCIIVCF